MPDHRALISVSIALPTQPPRASVNAIQCSADGQIAVMTRTEVHLITFVTGNNPSAAAAIPPTLSTTGPALKLFQTVTELSASGHRAWASESTELAAGALGSLSIACMEIAWSPTNLSTYGTCLLALLTTNLEVSIYAPLKNYLKGEWQKVMELTTPLLELNDALGTDQSTHSPVHRVLQAQTNCVAWSESASFSLLPSCRDTSLLALGNRAGSITLWRYDPKGQVFCQAVVRVSDTWVTGLSWSAWRGSSGTSESSLACSTADGAIKLLRVVQTIADDGNVSVLAAIDDRWHSPPDSRSTTSIKWISVERGHGSVLVFSRPGMMYIWSAPESGAIWKGVRSIPLQKQAIAAGSSSLGIPSGLDYSEAEDALLIALSDGSFHVIHNITRDPDPNAADGTLNSMALSKVARSVFIEIEGPGTTSASLMRTHGVKHIGYGAVLWMYRNVQPTSLLYVPEMTQQCGLAMANLWNCTENPEQFLNDLAKLISTPTSAARQSPHVLVLPIYLYLLRHLGDPVLLKGLTHLLIPPKSMTVDAEDRRGLGPPGTSVYATMEDAVRQALTLDIIDGPHVNSLRLMLDIAEAATKLGFDLLDNVSQLQSAVMIQVISGLLYCLCDTPLQLYEMDPAFCRRMLSITRRLPLCPASVVATAVSVAGNLGVALQTFPDPDDLSEATTTLTERINVEETCPACRKPQYMSDLSSAMCENGHTWERCAVTTLLLATPHVRACSGCSRKAHIPPSQVAYLTTTTVSHGWFVDQVLEAARCCLYCGHRFVLGL